MFSGATTEQGSSGAPGFGGVAHEQGAFGSFGGFGGTQQQETMNVNGGTAFQPQGLIPQYGNAPFGQVGDGVHSSASFGQQPAGGGGQTMQQRMANFGGGSPAGGGGQNLQPSSGDPFAGMPPPGGGFGQSSGQTFGGAPAMGQPHHASMGQPQPAMGQPAHNASMSHPGRGPAAGQPGHSAPMGHPGGGFGQSYGQPPMGQPGGGFGQSHGQPPMGQPGGGFVQSYGQPPMGQPADRGQMSFGAPSQQPFQQPSFNAPMGQPAGDGQMPFGQSNSFGHSSAPAPFQQGYGNNQLVSVQPGQDGQFAPPLQGAEPPCACGQPSTQRTVRKEGPNTGRNFFCCARPQGEQCKFFQFADEPPRADGQPQQPQQPQVEGPACPCGLPSMQLTTRKEGPNMGRVFFKCAKQQGEQCRYFQWADEPPPPAGQMPQGPQVDGPPCLCSQPTSQRTTRKEGPNLNRVFFTCAKPQGEQCGYFQWSDEAPPTTGPPCQCGTASINRTVGKEGPNKGRPYAACPTRKCQFFQWMDEENGQGPMGVPTPQRGGQAKGGQSFSRDVSADTCYKCNMTGHWASNCPNEDGAGKGTGRGKGGGRKGRGKGAKDGEQFVFDGGARYEPF